MCGIAGFWLKQPLTSDVAQTRLSAMTNALRHRGPDDSGAWYESGCGIALGHRRLSIVDLSPEGHQPMRSASGRYTIVFNGEVYNFAALRRDLEQGGHLVGPFRGHSDTEVMLAAIDAYGVAAAVQKFVGMFAFALWDAETRCVHLVRDRLGIKPLYLGYTRSGVLFGSELKALTTAPDFERELDLSALSLYAERSCVPAPFSIYRQAKKLMPGTITTLRSPSLDDATTTTYWSAAAAATQGLQNPFRGTDHEAIDELERQLLEAVRLRMVADVPLGAFLSGGVDSSTVVALMQAQSSQRVRTFSIGNETAAYDESGSARAVAEHLGTDHEGLIVSGRDALDVVPMLPHMFDEPFADPSQIPTYLVSRLARGRVTVALSGDGGDELLGGYNRHVWGPRVWRAVAHLPLGARRALAGRLTRLRPEHWDRVFARLSFLPRIRLPGHQVHKLARVLDVGSPEELYRRLCSQWNGDIVHGGHVGSAPQPLLADLGAQMMLTDTVTYLPDDILAKVDRASMAVALEARVPILDHRVVELAWRLPQRLKINHGQGKWVLRQVLQRYVPKRLIDRPKMGFQIPVGDWLRGPLRPWAEDLLAPGRMKQEGLFDEVEIGRHWSQHISGSGSWGYHLWNIVVFQQWLRSQGSASAPE